MGRGALIGIAVTLVAGVGALATVGVLALSADPAVQHQPGHANCPPGSHGKLWGADHGRMFKDALRSRRTVETGDAQSSPMIERAVTATRPAR